jgi:hypothetical protein
MKDLDEQREYNRNYYKIHKDKLLAKSLDYQKEHHSERLSYLKKWRSENKNYMKRYRFVKNSEVNANLRKSRKIKRDMDVQFRLRGNLNSRVWAILRQKKVTKCNHMLELLGCDVGYFKNYIEKQWQSGMVWDNYGSVWWIDHRIPVSWYDLSDPEEQAKAFHFSNCKPMFKIDNIKKRNFYAEPSLIQIFNGGLVK